MALQVPYALSSILAAKVTSAPHLKVKNTLIFRTFSAVAVELALLSI